MLELPAALRQHWYNRGYYGTVSHNVKAVYQKYLGWFDGNPANLHPLPPVEARREVRSSTWAAPTPSSHGPRRLREGRVPLGRRRS